MSRPLKILDCTLRDGGYYTDWDFSDELVETYLQAISRSGVDVVELGLRQLSQTNYLGPFAYTTRRFLERLELPESLMYGVMIDAKTFLDTDSGSKYVIRKLFAQKSEEKFDLVRIAAHFHELHHCREAIEELDRLGFTVGLNVMQASLRSTAELAEQSKILADSLPIEVLYFADSLGNMRANDVSRIYEAFRDGGWMGDVGFHAHNNTGNALNNVEEAISTGCRWIDSTVTGMGRGAGNAETELVLELSSVSRSEGRNAMYAAVSEAFEPLKREKGWGPSLLYFYAAKWGVHPTYVQSLLTDASVLSKDRLLVLEKVASSSAPNSFNLNVLDAAIADRDDHEISICPPIPTIFTNKEVVIVAQTETSKSLSFAIEDYIADKDAVLTVINYPSNDFNLNFHYCFVSHNKKHRQQRDQKNEYDYKIVAPKARYSDDATSIDIDYAVSVAPGEFSAQNNGCKIPADLTFAYAIAFSVAAGANKISLVGFEGYDLKDPRQKEMELVLRHILALDVELVSLHKTPYSIREVSIFAP